MKVTEKDWKKKKSKRDNGFSKVEYIIAQFIKTLSFLLLSPEFKMRRPGLINSNVESKRGMPLVP